MVAEIINLEKERIENEISSLIRWFYARRMTVNGGTLIHCFERNDRF
jgi:hypothetical protein